ncbi:dTDP-4-dehydrorhamnose reductase [Scopulibacillus daqui]|uniref:dTDP-4-dehydrorhamnose reductase n=1 Tax=Scopulibacillus daqui TaxID=1469162 RepID=A0ABS2PYE3_9BACL|nr:dTDP-4-dehydrorhamnose reductase [Scopulibacillus daqui]MBM7645057.1 dTDP-4-dehydrorhamnose reductase [Scopulibacillus daqui]
MSQKVLITGANGQLGRELTWILKSCGYSVYPFGHKQLDITNQQQTAAVAKDIRPHIVIHAAAYTNVDQAETDRDQAFAVNAYGTRNIAAASEDVRAKLVYISTDYVFNGLKEGPYHEFDNTSPLGVYGQSKLAGEAFVKDFHSKFFIIRTSWLFGRHGKNFVNTMLNLAKERKEVKVVNDQFGSPTYTVDLSLRLIDIIKTDQFGIYHISNTGACSWYEFAQAIFEESDRAVKVHPVSTADFMRPASRPKNSVFEHLSLRLGGFQEMRHWRLALKDFLEEKTDISR